MLSPEVKKQIKQSVNDFFEEKKNVGMSIEIIIKILEYYRKGEHGKNENYDAILEAADFFEYTKDIEQRTFLDLQIKDKISTIHMIANHQQENKNSLKAIQEKQFNEALALLEEGKRDDADYQKRQYESDELHGAYDEKQPYVYGRFTGLDKIKKAENAIKELAEQNYEEAITWVQNNKKPVECCVM